MESFNLAVDWATQAREEWWILQVFLVVLVTLLLNMIFRRSFNRIKTQLEKTSNPWDDALVAAAFKPVAYLIWLVGITAAISIAGDLTNAPIFEFVEPVRDVLFIALVTWFVVRFIKNAEHSLLVDEHNPRDETTVHAIAKLTRVAVFITASLVVLQSLGYSVSGVLAFGGVGGIAVGFAAKDLLANFFGGLMLYLDQPFKVGDWILSPDREIEGTVEEIGWRLTRIRTFDKRPLYVPNSMFASITVENPSRMTHRRIYEVFGIRYADVALMRRIVDEVKEMLCDHEDIAHDQTMIVNFNAFSPSSLDFFIYTFTKTTNWIRYHQVKQDVLLKVGDIVERNGAEMAFPTSTVHLYHDEADVESNPKVGV